MQQALQGGVFHIEYVIPKAKGGPTEVSNLALACISCNLHKSDRIELTDSASGLVVAVFNPRLHVWDEHFSWNEHQIEGKTPIGRATIEALHLNSERRIFVRQAEATFGLFPP